MGPGPAAMDYLSVVAETRRNSLSNSNIAPLPVTCGLESKEPTSTHGPVALGRRSWLISANTKVFPSTLALQLEVARMSKQISHSAAMYWPTLQQSCQDATRAGGVATFSSDEGERRRHRREAQGVPPSTRRWAER